MAAPLGKLEFYIVNPTTGLPVSGASVEVRKQGATVSNVVGATSYDVNNPGGVISAAESAVLYQPGGAVRDSNPRGVSAVTATHVDVAGPGWTGGVDDDRISPTTNLPTIYEDAEGAESKTNPLTTDANGYAYCWVAVGFYDAKVTKAGVLTERLLIDQYAWGVGKEISNVFTTGSQVVHQRDTSRTLAAGDILDRWLMAGAEKVRIDYDGKIVTAAGLTLAGALAGVTSLSMSGAFSGATTLSTSGNISTSGGSLAAANQPRCRAQLVADQVIPTGTPTTVNWDTEIYDTGSMHDNVTNNSRITIGETGVYVVTVMAEWTANATGTRNTRLAKNGATTNLNFAFNVGNGSAAETQIVSEIMPLTAGDYITVTVTQTSGGDLNLVGGTNHSSFSAVKIA